MVSTLRQWWYMAKRRESVAVPPHDARAERAILGAILLDNRLMEGLSSLLSPDSFYVDAHRIVFAAMQALSRLDAPIDCITLGNRILSEGAMPRIGGPTFLGDLTDEVSTASHAEHYAVIVSDLEAVRRTIEAAQRVAAEGMTFKAGSSAAEFVARATQRVGDVPLRNLERPRTLFSYADDVQAAYRAAQAGTAGIPMPWPTLNQMTGGLRIGTVTAFVARPSVGKSSIIVLIAKHAWELRDRAERVLVVSPEMRAQDMAERHFIMEAKVPYMSVVRGQLSSFEEPKLWSAMDRLRGEDRLWIVDGVTSDLSERSIDAAIQAVRPTLVCIDSFYDLNFPGINDNERVGKIARWVFRNCKRHRYACVVGSQQNREQEHAKSRGGGSRLGTIAFSDAIGQRFDVVLALERDEKLKQARQIRVRPIKIRRGFGMDPVALNWDFTRGDFSEVDSPEVAFEDDDIDGGRIPY